MSSMPVAVNSMAVAVAAGTAFSPRREAIARNRAEGGSTDAIGDADDDVEFDVTVSSQKNVKVRHSKEKWTAVAAHLRRCCSRGLVSDVDVVVALRAMAVAGCRSLTKLWHCARWQWPDVDR